MFLSIFASTAPAFRHGDCIHGPLLVSQVIHAGVAIVARHIGGLWTDTGWLLHAGSSVLSFVVIACLFAVIYKMLPEVRLTWRDVAVGALGTAALFTAGKYLIGAYPGSGRIGNSYGAAGSLLALLLWVYFSAQIFFLGAEFTRQYAIWFGSLRNAVGSAAGDTALPTRGSVHGDDA
jgi:membrane protein